MVKRAPITARDAAMQTQVCLTLSQRSSDNMAAVFLVEDHSPIPQSPIRCSRLSTTTDRETVHPIRKRMTDPVSEPDFRRSAPVEGESFLREDHTRRVSVRILREVVDVRAWK